ncbi:hypothetical protein XENTR_v10004615 [Xenopus tropicalis]|nr:hypothetical protein XENTR_v10004615 [Xenopus tropicalis]
MMLWRCREVVSLLLFVVSIVRCQVTIPKAVNESVTFTLLPYDGATEITWKIGPDKLAEIDETNKPYFYRLGDKAAATFSPGSLTINRLEKKDSGTYTAEVQVGRQTHTQTFQLAVYDAVLEPNVTCTEGEEPNTIDLRCFSPGDGTYQWRNGTRSGSGPVLVLSEQQNHTITKANAYGVVTCVVTNPASSKNRSLPLSSCVKETSSRTHIVIVIVLLVIGIVIGIIAGLWILCK